MQLGNSVIPKSVTKERIISNIDVFDFELEEEEMKSLSSFGYTERLFGMLDHVDHPDYPFHED